MTAEERYINEVLSHIPPGARRVQIEMDLRAHLAERVEHGESIDAAIRQFGDPEDLADSYLAAVPLVRAPFLVRTAAKLIDCAGLLAIGCAMVWVTWRFDGAERVPFLSGISTEPLMVAIIVLVGVVLWPGYFVLAEYYTGQTLGKRALDIHVVRESGARISMGQSLVRQLPLVGGFFLLDVLFALFTEKNQRAFELISKTRVVRIDDATE